MNLAVGGLIDQAIFEDERTTRWDTSNPKVFNVQILNSHHFHQVTGLPLPESPISATTYFQQGLPFFKIYEEPTSVAGGFSMVKSIGQIEHTKEPELGTHNVKFLQTLFPKVKNPTVKAPIGLDELHEMPDDQVTSFGKRLLSPHSRQATKSRTLSKQQELEPLRGTGNGGRSSSKGKRRESTHQDREVGFFNPAGLAPFRTVNELEREVRAQGQVLF